MLYYAMLFIVGFSTTRTYQPEQKKIHLVVCLCVYIREK